jgi:hypothetical protein
MKNNEDFMPNPTHELNFLVFDGVEEQDIMSYAPSMS